jgi:hypothetical protein
MSNPLPSARQRRITSRYTWLPLLSLLLKLTGIIGFIFWAIQAVIGLIAVGKAIYSLRDAWSSLHLIGVWAYAVGSQLVMVLLVLAAAELIGLAMDVEESCRRSADIAAGTITGTTPRIDS